MVSSTEREGGRENAYFLQREKLMFISTSNKMLCCLYRKRLEPPVRVNAEIRLASVLALAQHVW